MLKKQTKLKKSFWKKWNQNCFWKNKTKIVSETKYIEIIFFKKRNQKTFLKKPI